MEGDWRSWLARPAQLAPKGEWRVWLILAGRGFGKTRAGAEWVIERVKSGLFSHVALIAETSADARDVMVEGPESGILAVSPRDFLPNYEPSKRRLTWPNGAIATTYSGDEPDQLRGPQHDTAWADEPAKWKYAQQAWDNMQFGLRIGPKPQACATTTPKPTAFMKRLVKDTHTAITRGATWDNVTNLAPAFLEYIRGRYEGTYLGRQELRGELLEEVEGALWKQADIDKLRVLKHPDLVRVIVGVDPAATSTEDSDHTGIVVAGIGEDRQGYVLDDASLKGTPKEWASAAITAYYKHRADRIIAEVNNGGDMVEHTIRTVDADVSYKKIHASRGKLTRAEPVASLYEQGRIHHVGTFADLESEMCTWVPGDAKSPDRMDALVWALTELMVSGIHGKLGIGRLDELVDDEPEEQQPEVREEREEPTEEEQLFGDEGWREL